MTLDVVAATVIGDVALVIGVAWLFGAAARRCGQPTVIGQILAGVLLGPTLLGRLPGHLTSHLFPAYTLPFLAVLSQVAVVIFMFAVAYEIDFRSLRGTAGRCQWSHRARCWFPWRSERAWSCFSGRDSPQ